MSEGGAADSGKHSRPPHSQQGRSPRRQPLPQPQHRPAGSSTAHQVAGYIMPPQQQNQQQQMQYSSGGGIVYSGYPPPQQQQQPQYRQHPPVGPQHSQHPPPHYAPVVSAAVAAASAGMVGQMPPQIYTANMPAQQQTPQQHPIQHESYIQPRVGRLPADRPIMKLSVGLIETYKQINEVSISKLENDFFIARPVGESPRSCSYVLFRFGVCYLHFMLKYDDS
jgi:hypothetical protein